MLENINLTLNDTELKNNENIKSVSYLSTMVYILPFMRLSIWTFAFFYVKLSYHKVVAVFQFIADHLTYVRAIASNLGYSKESFYNGLAMIFNVIGQYIIPFILLCLIFRELYKLISLAKTRIIVDNMGVWVKRGIFKFTTEASGVVWNNADLASSKNGLIYYLFKNYPISIKNRFSGAVEISLPPVRNGKNLLALINTEISARYNQTTNQL